MSSLSLSRIPRPYQFALLAVLLIAVLWFVVLHKMVSSSSSETSTPAVHSPTFVHRAVTPAAAAARAQSAAATVAPAARSHTAAPRANSGVHPAHPAAAASTHPASAQATHKATATAQAPATKSHVPAAAAAAGAAGAHSPSASVSVVKQIEGQLAERKVVLVLFWNPRATTDSIVHREMAAAGRSFGSRVGLYYALARQVAEFGTFTQQTLITETPTIMLIAPGKQVTTLTGYNTDSTITQAIEEAGARRAPAHAAKPHK